MAKRKSTKGRTMIYKTHIAKDRVTQTPLKTGERSIGEKGKANLLTGDKIYCHLRNAYCVAVNE